MQHTDWKSRWLAEAAVQASYSKDPNTKVGCVAVIGNHRLASGYNGFPRRIRDDAERYNDRVTKHRLIVHAEANLVAYAAYHGIQLLGSVVYSTYPCCPACATLLINAGVSAVFVPEDVTVPEYYRAEADIGARIFHEASIPYNYRIDENPATRMTSGRY